MIGKVYMLPKKVKEAVFAKLGFQPKFSHLHFTKFKSTQDLTYQLCHHSKHDARYIDLI